eukprot:TRINITY_DN1305_c0_g1_i3.p1 TRINITY_DN1305_c0_g1~~TRINITY_DN1305_c0_g1_i3.p1  ORF type:complete len:226 (+),score=50.09 TRINITY_DN1305_c0_g1_i3:337-1014(+)
MQDINSLKQQSKETKEEENGDCFWVFGYGSLLWKPSFPFIRRVDGYIKGYLRTFYQGSTDHRGIPGSPGRVVTLLPHHHIHVKELLNPLNGQMNQSITWGAAFCIESSKREEVIAYLDYREKGGYTQSLVEVFGKDSDQPFCKALIYLATPENEEYLGPSSYQLIAKQIIDAKGPSGPNLEYLLNLAQSLRSMNVVDHHVFQLENTVNELLSLVEKTNNNFQPTT